MDSILIAQPREVIKIEYVPQEIQLSRARLTDNIDIYLSTGPAAITLPIYARAIVMWTKWDEENNGGWHDKLLILGRNTFGVVPGKVDMECTLSANGKTLTMASNWKSQYQNAYVSLKSVVVA